MPTSKNPSPRPAQDEEASRAVLRSLDRALTVFAGLDEFLVPPPGVAEERMAAAAARFSAAPPGLHTDLLVFASRLTACFRAMGVPGLDDIGGTEKPFS